MKKLFTFILIIAGLTAQAQQQKGFGLTFRSGVSYMNFRYNNGGALFKPDSPLLSFGGGVFYDIPLNKRLTLRPQLTYVNYGSTNKYELRDPKGVLPDGTANITFSHHNIANDWVLRYDLANDGIKIRPFVGVGLRTNVYLSTSQRSTFTSSGYGDMNVTGRNDFVKGIHLGGIAVIGFVCKKWEAGLEYNANLTQIDKSTVSRNASRTLTLFLSHRF